MSSGLMMMVKSLGIDPEEIMKTAEGFKVLAQQVDARLNRMEAKIDALLLQDKKAHETFMTKEMDVIVPERFNNPETEGTDNE